MVIRVRADRLPECEQIARNKRRAIMGLDDVQADRIKNSCNGGRAFSFSPHLAIPPFSVILSRAKNLKF